MTMALEGLDSGRMATPRPLTEIAAELGLSARTMWRLAGQLGLTKYRMPGGGKRTYLDPDEVKKKLRPVRVPSR